MFRLHLPIKHNIAYLIFIKSFYHHSSYPCTSFNVTSATDTSATLAYSRAAVNCPLSTSSPNMFSESTLTLTLYISRRDGDEDDGEGEKVSVILNAGTEDRPALFKMEEI